MAKVADTLSAPEKREEKYARDIARLRQMAAGFSRIVLGKPLRDYQLDVTAAILESIHSGRGATFTVMMARQMGKNELSAHLEAMLLCRFAPRGASIVKAAPTFRPQVTTSLQRLEKVLLDAQQLAPLERVYKDGRKVALKHKKSHSYQIEVGDARVLFLSADPNASVVGATASLLLEIDEAQDVDPEKFARDFKPMAAANNATIVLYGTAWTQDTLLEQQKAINLRLEQQDGVRRHFEFNWQAGANANPKYGKFVESQIAERGIHHPLIRTQYLLLPLSEAGAFFIPEHRSYLQGDHLRQTTPTPEKHMEDGAFYVAGIDVAGGAEVPQDADHLLRAAKPRKDSTVILIAEVIRPTGPDAKNSHPLTRIVEAYWWTGRPLHEQCDTLVSLLREWRCRRAVVDASGLGADLALRLQRTLGEKLVEPFSFNVSSKSDLAYALLAHVGSGRLQMWAEHLRGAPRKSGPLLKLPRLARKSLAPASQGFGALSPEAGEFWREVERARPIHRTTGTGAYGNNKLSFYVPEQYGHDDFLTALALLSRAASSQVLATPLVLERFVVPPAPTESELEEQRLKIERFAADATRDFYRALRGMGRSDPPPPPISPSTPSPFPFRPNPAYDEPPSHSISTRDLDHSPFDDLPPGTERVQE